MFHKTKKELGQSLVETALFLPLLIVILAGLVEVSNILVTSNRVTTAARSSSGFGANNITSDDWANNGTEAANNMAVVARRAVTETLDLDPNLWDIWIIKAKTNSNGGDFSEWNVFHPYGENTVVSTADWANNEAELKAETLAQLRSENRDASNLEIVATVAYYNARSMLGLVALENFTGLNKVEALSILRVDEQTDYTTEGGQTGNSVCSIFPIAYNYNNFTIYPSDYTGGPAFDPNDPVFKYDGSSLAVPSSPPAYTLANKSAFPLNVSGKSVAEAQPGYIYEITRNSSEIAPGNFAWLSWDGQNNAVALANSLDYPGNLVIDANPPSPFVRYVNPNDPNDLVPSIGDWVQGGPGNVNSAAVRDAMDEHFTDEHIIMLPVYDNVQGTGSNVNYRIAAFALVKVHGYKISGNQNDRRFLVEFRGWGDCADIP